MIPVEYIVRSASGTAVLCKVCREPLVVNGAPTPEYDQLVLTMRTPEGGLSTHEMLLCRRCCEWQRRRPVADLGKLRELYEQDVHQMVVSHRAARGSLSPQRDAAVAWLRAHEIVCIRDEVGSSVQALRAKGALR